MSLLDTLAGTTTEDLMSTPVIMKKEDHRPRPLADKGVADQVALEVIPYDARADALADRMLPWLWQQMQKDDLVDLYFPGQEQTGFATVVRMLSGDSNVGMFKLKNPADDTIEATLPGFITWTTFPMGASRTIIAGFIFFKRWWGHGVPDEAARVAFNYWFNGSEPIDIVLGSCPSLHKLAIAYNERVGLREIGRIPEAHLYKGRKCDAILYAMTKREWSERCQQQR